MSDTQALLGKITALRQRLEQAQGLVSEANAAVADLAVESEDSPAERLASLEQKATTGRAHSALLDSALRRLSDPAVPLEEARVLPTRLTSRARRIIENGRDLLARLRALAEHFPETPLSLRGSDTPRSRPEPSEAPDPLSVCYRETLAMTDTTLRTVQAFPDAPSVQLRLCEGLEAILGVVGQRLATITAAVVRRRREADQVAALSAALTELHNGQAADVKPFMTLAESILEDAEQNAPLRFLYASPEDPAHFVACHSLTVAQVIARVVRSDADWRGRSVESVLAGLVHDVGMLSVPVEVLCRPGPLDDDARRIVESHVRLGSALAIRLLPSGAWLAEAVAGHHERLAGTGYPAGLRELQIVPLVRLLAVCDVYAALCAPRPYRPARETRTALADTLLLADQGALDRNHAEKLLHLSFYPVGSVVELADGVVGLVIAAPVPRQDLNTPARPVVALLTDAQGRSLPGPQPIDLAQSDSRSIVRTLSPVERRELLGRRYPELV